MKKMSLLAGVFSVLLVSPAFSPGGNIHGSEARGEPLNSSYRASAVDAQTGFTPGASAARAKAYVHVKKKKHYRVTTTGSATRR